VTGSAGEGRTEEGRVVRRYPGALRRLVRILLETVLVQAPHLAVLLGDKLLVECRYLDVDVELGKVEVRREPVGNVAGAIPVDVEGRRLVEPIDLIEVEKTRELSLAVVREVDQRVGKAFGGATLGACGYV
jgi:hypothetical protein